MSLSHSPCVRSTSAPEDARREAAGRAVADMDLWTERCDGDDAPPAGDDIDNYCGE